jgi:hypothetical protein
LAHWRSFNSASRLWIEVVAQTSWLKSRASWGSGMAVGRRIDFGAFTGYREVERDDDPRNRNTAQFLHEYSVGGGGSLCTFGRQLHLN